jgi:nucleoid DNA-binding protein
MTKNKLIEKISKDLGIRKEEAEDIYFMFFKFIIDSLKKREKVKISDFGTFYVKKVKGKIDIFFKPLGKFRKL